MTYDELKKYQPEAVELLKKAVDRKRLSHALRVAYRVLFLPPHPDSRK